jgi:2-polyprenyl-3-methyl-5-hydroxy-6-metoxy-1,4-benzoquinol methylase
MTNINNGSIRDRKDNLVSKCRTNLGGIDTASTRDDPRPAMAGLLTSMDVVTVNREFYDSLYKAAPSWLSAIRALTSFDQQTKAKPNYVIAKELVADKGVASEKVRILDYGAGWGSFLLKWPTSLASCWCYDISCESVKQCLSAGRLLRRNITQWSGMSQQFDLVCCSHVLEHVPDDLALLHHLRGLTRYGGVVLLNVPINEVLADPKHIRSYTRESLRSVIEAAGLVVVLEKDGDRLSTFLAKRQVAGSPSAVSRMAWRTLRLLLALMPYGLLSQLDRLLSCYAPSQLIVGARKDS